MQKTAIESTNFLKQNFEKSINSVIIGREKVVEIERDRRSGEIGQRDGLQNRYAPVRARPTPPSSLNLCPSAVTGSQP